MRYKMAKLIKMAENELRRLGFTESTIKDQYSKYWHIMLTDIGDKEVSKDDFVNACIRHYGIDIMNTPFNELTTYHSRMKSKSLCLLEFQDRGFIDGKPYSSRPKQMLSETMLNLILDFLDIQKQRGNSDSTIENKRSRIASFVNRYPLNSLSTDSILHYVDNLKRHERIGARENMSIIRNFLEFAYKCGRIPVSYSELFPKFKIRMGTSRPSVYSADEIEVISRYYKSGTNKCSSRNHAILMFLIHYGLRAKDISDMQRNQIDWERDTISIVTSKTKETITFPLLPIVGNSLLEYLLHSRPSSQSKYLFLGKSGKKLSASSISGIARKAITSSGVHNGNRRCGAHSLRASLATRLMESNTPMLDIAKILGHASMNTTKIYMKVDIQKLRLCELEVVKHEK